MTVRFPLDAALEAAVVEQRALAEFRRDHLDPARPRFVLVTGRGVVCSVDSVANDAASLECASLRHAPRWSAAEADDFLVRLQAAGYHRIRKLHEAEALALEIAWMTTLLAISSAAR